MELQLAMVRSRRLPPSSPEGQIITRYVERAQKFVPCALREFGSELALLEHLERAGKRTAPYLALADSGGRLLTSDEFSSALGEVRAAGTQLAVLAIGPADGWSAAARQRANLLLSFGRVTLPHELAAAVAAEQVYRALTILAGHPYHSGH